MIRFLTVCQPFASLIASGEKPVELRSWRTEWRGVLVIVSGQRVIAGTAYPVGPTGQALCLVKLKDIVPAKPSHSKGACFDVDEYSRDYCRGRQPFAWILEPPLEWNTKPLLLHDIPMKGAQGLRRVSDELRTRVYDRLDEEFPG